MLAWKKDLISWNRGRTWTNGAPSPVKPLYVTIYYPPDPVSLNFSRFRARQTSGKLWPGWLDRSRMCGQENKGLYCVGGKGGRPSVRILRKCGVYIHISACDEFQPLKMLCAGLFVDANVWEFLVSKWSWAREIFHGQKCKTNGQATELLRDPSLMYSPLIFP